MGGGGGGGVVLLTPVGIVSRFYHVYLFAEAIPIYRFKNMVVNHN